MMLNFDWGNNISKEGLLNFFSLIFVREGVEVVNLMFSLGSS